MFLCYDPTPEGYDPYELQNFPKALMRKKYLGNALNKTLNYGNWMNWAYDLSVGFPLLFSAFYVKRFINNIMQKHRERRLEKDMWRPREMFYTPLQKAWADMKRRLRNLAVKTYAGGITRRWYEEYKRTDYPKRFERLFPKKIRM